jgi:chemotaxis signal transduction protein
MTSASPVSARAMELRRVFDQARALPFASGKEEQTESLLAVRVSGDAYAIKVGEITSLVAGRKIVAIPSPIPELVGLAGIRGALVPVYSLHVLLGYIAPTQQSRWLVLCGTEDSFALALDDFEGYLRIAGRQVYPIEQKDAVRIHVKEVVRATDMVRAVVSIPLLRETIRERCRKSSVPKER